DAVRGADGASAELPGPDGPVGWSAHRRWRGAAGVAGTARMLTFTSTQVSTGPPCLRVTTRQRAATAAGPPLRPAGSSEGPEPRPCPPTRTVPTGSPA